MTLQFTFTSFVGSSLLAHCHWILHMGDWPHVLERRPHATYLMDGGIARTAPRTPSPTRTHIVSKEEEGGVRREGRGFGDRSCGLALIAGPQYDPPSHPNQCASGMAQALSMPAVPLSRTCPALPQLPSHSGQSRA